MPMSKQSCGPSWELPLGRRDSNTASLSTSNNNIPPPNSTLQNLITLYQRQGLDEVDLVALSGQSLSTFSDAKSSYLNGLFI